MGLTNSDFCVDEATLGFAEVALSSISDLP